MSEPQTDPLMRSVQERAHAIETAHPDLPAAADDASPARRAADVMDEARRVAEQGSDAELGALDADLARVAANCALTLGR